VIGEGALLSFDLALMSAAAHYDLRERSERLRSNRDLEELFFHLVKLLKPDLFVEAGAKDAESSRRARRYVPDARIVAFEANPYTYRRFERLYRRRNAKLGVEYLHLALSDSPGTRVFNVRRAASGRPVADGQGSLLLREDHEPGHERVSVRTTTLDTHFRGPEHGTCAMWVDVEGAGRLVLQGGTELLSSVDFLIIEVQDRDYWGGAWLRKDVIRFFSERGLVPVARDFQSRYLYNVVFLRKPLMDVDVVRHCLASHHSRCGRGARERGAKLNAVDALLAFLAPGLSDAQRKKLRTEPGRFLRDIDFASVARRAIDLVDPDGTK
jgi:FkbM family methyltransferase